MGSEFSTVKIFNEDGGMYTTIFDENGDRYISADSISIVQILLKNCDSIPKGLLLNLGIDITIDNNNFIIDKETNLIFYNKLIMAIIVDAIPIDNNLLITIKNIKIESCILDMVIDAIKKREKILKCEFVPSSYF
uniref:Uncharacterized protein n=1 Tax=viral metagenome TaxID=1070528 RepID=A0A6C0I1G9_9ZZZZ